MSESPYNASVYDKGKQVLEALLSEYERVESSYQTLAALATRHASRSGGTSPLLANAVKDRRTASDTLFHKITIHLQSMY